MKLCLSRIALAVLFVIAGALHFVLAEKYRQIVPPQFPAPGALVAISGIAEIVGGAGVLVPSLRRAAGWGLIALLLCVFPANVYMAIHPERFHLPAWMLWGRLPVQGLLIVWVWSATLRRPNVKA
ncbi:MAG: DoxX family protein [Tepidisphaeraceae bacterium]